MNALIVGGSSGIGLSLVLTLVARDDVESVYIMDKNSFPIEYSTSKITAIICDISKSDYLEMLPNPSDIQMLYITAGFGHLKLFGDLSAEYIQNIFAVNAVAPIEIIRHYYNNMQGQSPFACAVMVSIAGRLNSPLFSVYSATKAALSKCIEAINVELDQYGAQNRILEVSPGNIKGTAFSGGSTQPTMTMDLAKEIINRAEHHERLYIPQYEEIFKSVIERYSRDAHQFGLESYQYKMNGRK